jgi:hypothetical protein
MGHNAQGTAENESGHAKNENVTRRTRYRRKQIWRAKHENGTRRPRNRRKREGTLSVPPKTSPGAQNMKTGSDALGTAENESGSAKT